MSWLSNSDNSNQIICDQDVSIAAYRPREKLSRGIVVGLIALGDTLLVICSAILVKLTYVDMAVRGTYDTLPYACVGIIGGILNYISMRLLGEYNNSQIDGNAPVINIIKSLVVSFVVLLVLGFLLRITDRFARGWLIIWFCTSAISLVVARRLIGARLRKLAKQGLFNKAVAIIGAEPFCTRLREYIERNTQDVDVVGVFAPASTSVHSGAGGLRAELRKLLELGRKVHLDRVIIVLPAYEHAQVQEILLELSPLPADVDYCPGELALRVKLPTMSYIGNAGFYNLCRHPITEWGVVAKRAFDLAIAIPALIVLAFPLFAIGVIVRLTSPGKALFVQERHGLNNRVIRVLKFRTMTDVKRAGDHQVTRDTAEVTPFGRLLRRTSLDELPQLINVILGDMSLVGPRPHAVKMNEKFADVIRRNEDFERLERYAARHKVKPGITGWAQVNNLRGQTDTRDKIEKRVEHDLYYINNWSIRLDLKIIILTFAAVAKGENAY